MTNNYFLIASIVLFIATPLIFYFDLKRQSVRRRRLEKEEEIRKWKIKEGMPFFLRGGRAFLNEAEISIKYPVPLHGRVDQVFETKSSGLNMLTIVDTKTRKRFKTYQSDLIQLSVYRLILQEKYKGQYKVNDTGFVRIVVRAGTEEERVSYEPLDLLSDNEVIDLYYRHKDIKTGKREAKCTCDGRLH
ncbi:PD-(D/E)XK nuclease family protein [Marinomonas algarum]|uniref:PD-(D/E)XK nuclease family protein n=1 Tax=Marinomonas algarum TaxID=2883105 RepID=A0A9X1INQ3_9GAMM|nr:PD-(D/E)XK nuclease family protein [Marinomonas algarum]MCB5162618.1 PD-(D/E)XK nuclease family protein [Marinomonas algarum]